MRDLSELIEGGFTPFPGPGTPRMLRADALESLAVPWSVEVDPRWAPPVRSRVGQMYTLRTDMAVGQTIRRHGLWENDMGIHLASAIRPGMRVIDVGANIGYFTLLMARAVGPTGAVLAVEPAPTCLGLLTANLSLNAITTAEVAAVALDRQPGEVRMVLPQLDNLGAYQAFGTGLEPVEHVPCRRLDDLLDPAWPVHVIKIDAPGMDFRAVEGAISTIERWRPTVLVEYEPHSITGLGDVPVEELARLSRSGFIVEVAGWSFRRELMKHPGIDALLDRHLNVRGYEQQVTQAIRPGGSVMLICRYIGG